MSNTSAKKKNYELPRDYHPSRPAILDLAGATKSQSCILPVRRVGFHGQTYDDRSPESFPLPACMTSVMETLGEGYGDVTIYAHNRSYTKRLGNHMFLAASGMAFGFLWSDQLDYRTMDLTQITPLNEVVRRIMAFAGYTYELFEAGQYNKDTVYRKILNAIDNGTPVITFGLFRHPECSIIAGYENLGQALLGWSHFQFEAKAETAENGMFRISDWDDNWTSIVILHDKVGRTLTYEDALHHGLEQMQKTQVNGYDAGYAAFAKWISMLEADTVSSELYAYHKAILFNYAELRAWGCDFLKDAGCKQGGKVFMKIHDLCWKADAAAKGEEAFAIHENRVKVAEILREIVRLDHVAESLIKEFLESKKGKDA